MCSVGSQIAFGFFKQMLFSSRSSAGLFLSETTQASTVVDQLKTWTCIPGHNSSFLLSSGPQERTVVSLQAWQSQANIQPSVVACRWWAQKRLRRRNANHCQFTSECAPRQAYIVYASRFAFPYTVKFTRCRLLTKNLAVRQCHDIQALASHYTFRCSIKFRSREKCRGVVNTLVCTGSWRSRQKLSCLRHASTSCHTAQERAPNTFKASTLHRLWTVEKKQTSVNQQAYYPYT